MGFRPLELVRPFLSVLPDIQVPERRVQFREKALYTAVALFVFLVCSQLPLYGIKTNSGSDPFYWARVIMASNRCARSNVCCALAFARADQAQCCTISLPSRQVAAGTACVRGAAVLLDEDLETRELDCASPIKQSSLTLHTSGAGARAWSWASAQLSLPGW